MTTATHTPPYLSDDEVRELTRVKQGAAQIRHLERMGVPFRIRADGTPCVWRWDLQEHQAKAKSAQPKWSRAA